MPFYSNKVQKQRKNLFNNKLMKFKRLIQIIHNLFFNFLNFAQKANPSFFIVYNSTLLAFILYILLKQYNSQFNKK